MNLLRYLYRVFFLNVDQLISLTEILYREKIIQKNKEHSARKNQEQWSLWKLVVIWFLFFFFQGNPRLNLAFLANLFHCRPGLEFHATDMESARLIEELNTAHVRYCQELNW